MYKIRLKEKPHLFVPRKHISYAIINDKGPQSWAASADFWLVTENRAYCWGSIQQILNSLNGICLKDETYSKYEVLNLVDNTVQPLDDFLNWARISNKNNQKVVTTMAKTTCNIANVNKILHQYWNPIIPGVPEDEFENYAAVIVLLLKQSLGRHFIINYLIESATKTIGNKEADLDSINKCIEEFEKNGWFKI